VLQEAVDNSLVDEVLPVAGPEGVEWAQKLARSEGIFVGISAGATFAVAIQVAQTAPAGSVILAMLPDTGERYLSTPLFEGVEEDMDDDELALMKSTPGYQLS
jgi:cysteine synthase A